MICTEYENDQRCTRQATHQVVSDTGASIPGSRVCEQHGRVTVDEYKDKLGWEWTLQPIDGEVTRCTQ